jgi:hypothetical protein
VIGDTLIVSAPMAPVFALLPEGESLFWNGPEK